MCEFPLVQAVRECVHMCSIGESANRTTHACMLTATCTEPSSLHPPACLQSQKDLGSIRSVYLHHPDYPETDLEHTHSYVIEQTDVDNSKMPK